MAPWAWPSSAAWWRRATTRSSPPPSPGCQAHDHATASASLAGALDVGARIGGDAGLNIATTARDAYASGMNTATLVGAVVAAVGSVVVYRKPPATRHLPNRAAAAPAPTAPPIAAAEVD